MLVHLPLLLDEDERNGDERYEDGRDEVRNEERETEQVRGE